MADTSSGREARPAPDTSAAGGAGGRVHGTPAPEYGEYAPAGWVNPVLVEQERRATEERERAARAEPATPSQRSAPGRAPAQRPDGRPAGTALPTSRYGASQFDFVVTVGLLAFGLFSVLQSLAVTEVASRVREAFRQQGLQLSDPGALSTAAVVGAISSVVVFALVAWWSLRRLRARKWTFWVPLLGGGVASLISLVAFVLVMFQDPGFVQALLQQSGA
ncbi:DUF6264 family protein [Curtobacterium sp. MCSS17_007]|uniref:DUF6264 family protein n=1 Tax=Curtobacterium sp. MCSS17_007 TaxID=2175646 RepID=UPI0011B6F94D|nr:DUF6264 family protein [Curtobacterium sp. MCSS17_007]WIE76372.1 DUF6264 family protein [Curtobacterium sp. MCSS17_007]